ncbi:hypothetical protein F01_290046 [Burkholderia cenocepacia]|nr:hypothetical protein F01_290046 [Burkholderia cenocepacia]
MDARRRGRRTAGRRLRRSPRARLRQCQGSVTGREYPADTAPRVRSAFDRLPDRGGARRAGARPLRGVEGRPRADVRAARGAVRADVHRGRADRRRRAALAIARRRRCGDARAARTLGAVLPRRRDRAAARAPVQLQRPHPLLLAAAGRRGRGRAAVRQPRAAAGAGDARRAVAAGCLRGMPRGRPREGAARMGAPPDTRRDRALCARVRHATAGMTGREGNDATPTQDRRHFEQSQETCHATKDARRRRPLFRRSRARDGGLRGVRRHADDRDAEQPRHDRVEEAVAGVREGEPRHQAELGDPRGERAAPARDDRHHDRQRPVRRDGDRHL